MIFFVCPPQIVFVFFGIIVSLKRNWKQCLYAKFGGQTKSVVFSEVTHLLQTRSSGGWGKG